jgi:hypothetical protein
MEKGEGSMRSDIEHQLTKVGQKLIAAKKKIQSLESQGVKVKVTKRIRKFIDSGKDKV